MSARMPADSAVLRSVDSCDKTALKSVEGVDAPLRPSSALRLAASVAAELVSELAVAALGLHEYRAGFDQGQQVAGVR